MDNILEYYEGNPDTVYEYDDRTKKVKHTWGCMDDSVISFGWFQTDLEGHKEFIKRENKMHYEIADELALKIIGKALRGMTVNSKDVEDMSFLIDHYGFFKGRVFIKPKVIATWYKVSSAKLAEILNLLGGMDLFKDYTYVCERKFDAWEKQIIEGASINVIDYINSNDGYVNPNDKYDMGVNIADEIDEKIIDAIIAANAPNSKLADLSSKLGKMTIAQYNSLIHQEGKKSKNTIKEINMKENKYKKEFGNYIEIMKEALDRNDFNTYNSAKNMLDESVDEYKHGLELIDEMNTVNFGILNHVFEQELPRLIKSNKKAVKSVIKTIKEDKNLLGQFNFYNVIKEQYKGKRAEIMESNDALEKLAAITINGIDQNTVKESNKKLRKIMKENNIIPSEFVDDESRQLYEAGHIILTKKKTASNMMPLMESYRNVCAYMDKHKGDDVNEAMNIDEMIENFEDKLKNNLNESEISFVKQITDFKTPIGEQRKEKLFNKIKEDCMKAISTMVNEDAENGELNSLKKQLQEMKFNNDTIVGDIAKLLEIRDILLDN